MENTTSNILSEQRNGNLFISLRGDYQGEWRSTLGAFIGSYDGEGNIFVNTEKLNNLLPTVKAELKEIFIGLGRLGKKIFFIGRKGFDICPDGYRVIVRNKLKCCGKCKNCSC